MDLTDLNGTIVLLCGLAMVVGVCGVVVPVLPGVLLCWLSVLAWAIFSDAGGGKWAVLAIATVIALLGTLAKYAWPGQRLKRSGVPTRSLVLGGLLAIIGFFLIPIVGLPLGFVLGIWLSELGRLQDSKSAWASTRHGLKAVGLSLIIELAAALFIAATWVAGLVMA